MYYKVIVTCVVLGICACARREVGVSAVRFRVDVPRAIRQTAPTSLGWKGDNIKYSPNFEIIPFLSG